MGLVVAKVVGQFFHCVAELLREGDAIFQFNFVGGLRHAFRFLQHVLLRGLVAAAGGEADALEGGAHTSSQLQRLLHLVHRRGDVHGEVLVAGGHRADVLEVHREAVVDVVAVPVAVLIGVLPRPRVGRVAAEAEDGVEDAICLIAALLAHWKEVQRVQVDAVLHRVAARDDVRLAGLRILVVVVVLLVVVMVLIIVVLVVVVMVVVATMLSIFIGIHFIRVVVVVMVVMFLAVFLITIVVVVMVVMLLAAIFIITIMMMMVVVMLFTALIKSCFFLILVVVMVVTPLTVITDAHLLIVILLFQLLHVFLNALSGELAVELAKELLHLIQLLLMQTITLNGLLRVVVPLHCLLQVGQSRSTEVDLNGLLNLLCLCRNVRVLRHHLINRPQLAAEEPRSVGHRAEPVADATLLGQIRVAAKVEEGTYTMALEVLVYLLLFCLYLQAHLGDVQEAGLQIGGQLLAGVKFGAKDDAAAEAAQVKVVRSKALEQVNVPAGVGLEAIRQGFQCRAELVRQADAVFEFNFHIFLCRLVGATNREADAFATSTDARLHLQRLFSVMQRAADVHAGLHQCTGHLPHVLHLIRQAVHFAIFYAGIGPLPAVLAGVGEDRLPVAVCLVAAFLAHGKEVQRGEVDALLHRVQAGQEVTEVAGLILGVVRVMGGTVVVVMVGCFVVMVRVMGSLIVVVVVMGSLVVVMTSLVVAVVVMVVVLITVVVMNKLEWTGLLDFRTSAKIGG
ncbi:hypothetical protein TYRP_023370 [Tyrophagus putrescentiae]|nr:hypothetical protein TYRP_023370 [Tyrophagus putrescentiae]